MARERLIMVAQGREKADVVLKNAKVFHTYLGEFETADIAVADGRVAAIGTGYAGKEEIDLAGKYVIPGLINAHLHIESSMLAPSEFARAVLPLGTTTVIADPHEIANVAGVDGIKYMLEAVKDIPLNVYFTLPSCVPSTNLEHSGAVLSADDLRQFVDDDKVLGLAEMMNVPGVLNADAEIMKKIHLMGKKRVDGHAPALLGNEVMAYASAGINSDHECNTPEEAKQRLKAGMYILIREGSAAKNMKAILPIINKYSSQFCCICTDDRHPADLLEEGDINYTVRLAVKHGISVATAIQMATINAARYFGLNDIGAIAPGFLADLVVLDNIADFRPELVYKSGKLVAKNGKMLVDVACIADSKMEDSVHLAKVTLDDFKIEAKGDKANVIELIPYQLVTKRKFLPVKKVRGEAAADPERDILKLAVFERHHATGQHGLGFIKGFGLKKGAIGSTVGHDSHNLIVVGANDEDMLLAVKTLEKAKGGMVIVADGEVAGLLPLEIAGLMSKLTVEETAERVEKMRSIAYDLGVNKEYDPFITLAFMSLPVIPDLKLTDMGLVDVNEFRIIGLEEE